MSFKYNIAKARGNLKQKRATFSLDKLVELCLEDISELFVLASENRNRESYLEVEWNFDLFLQNRNRNRLCHHHIEEMKNKEFLSIYTQDKKEINNLIIKNLINEGVKIADTGTIKYFRLDV